MAMEISSRGHLVPWHLEVAAFNSSDTRRDASETISRQRVIG
jgi:hypothetical protein